MAKTISRFHNKKDHERVGNAFFLEACLHSSTLLQCKMAKNCKYSNFDFHKTI